MAKRYRDFDEETVYWQGKLDSALSAQDALLLTQAVDKLGLNPEDFDEPTQELIERGRAQYQSTLDHPSVLTEEPPLRQTSPPGQLEQSVNSSQLPTNQLEQSVVSPPTGYAPNQSYIPPVKERDLVDCGVTDPIWVEEREARKRVSSKQIPPQEKSEPPNKLSPADFYRYCSQRQIYPHSGSGVPLAWREMKTALVQCGVTEIKGVSIDSPNCHSYDIKNYFNRRYRDGENAVKGEK